jgi:tripartite-type tricarboxylate transporter receptor subunit TctC
MHEKSSRLAVLSSVPSKFDIHGGLLMTVAFKHWAWTACAAFTLAAPAQSQQYPSRNITLVVPFAPGGLSDIPGRLLAAELQTRTGHSVIVENKPGASGMTGAQSVLKAEPDGYTLLVNALADGQNLHYITVPYSAINDFSLIGLIADGPPLVLIVANNTTYKSVADIVADAKADWKRIAPGQFQAEKEALDRASVRLQEISVAASLRSQ